MLTKVKDTLPLGRLYPLQLWSGVHWRDQTETGDKNEGAWERWKEKSAVAQHAWENHAPPDPLGGDLSAGPCRSCW